MGAIAFFDLDKTLLGVNSATLWIKRELHAGNITRMQALHAGIWVALYSIGVADVESVILAAVQQLKGQKERDVIERTLAFYREEVAPTLRPGARAAVQRHKDAGDLCFLLTSSSNYLSAPMTDLLKLDGFLANRFLTEGGLYTGDAVRPVCFGRGKVAHAQAVSEKLHVPLSECWFYTDSYSDLPMLQAVGHPVVVHPDGRLRRYANKHAWPIEDWGEAPKALLKSPP
jgi:HAD superfamily hydrolase (TIGR01490 family)